MQTRATPAAELPGSADCATCSAPLEPLFGCECPRCAAVSCVDCAVTHEEQLCPCAAFSLTLRNGRHGEQRLAVSLYRGGPIPAGARRFAALTGRGAVEELCHQIGLQFYCADTTELESILRDDVGLSFLAEGTVCCVMAWPEASPARRAA